MRQRARADNLTVCNRKKEMDVSFSCVFAVIDNEFRHNIVKVVCGSTATLTMLWRNSWSIIGQTHEKLTSICWLDKVPRAEWRLENAACLLSTVQNGGNDASLEMNFIRKTCTSELKLPLVAKLSARFLLALSKNMRCLEWSSPIFTCICIFLLLLFYFSTWRFILLFRSIVIVISLSFVFPFLFYAVSSDFLKILRWKRLSYAVSCRFLVSR